MKAKISIMRDNLLYATDKAILFIRKNPVLPVQTMFKFKPDPLGGLSICAFDGETYVECHVPCEISEEINSFCVSATKIHQLIKLCPDPEIEISFKKKGLNNMVVFKSPRSAHEFTMYPDDMPTLNKKAGDLSVSFTMNGADLHAIAETIVNLVDENESNKKALGMGLGFQYIDDQKAMFVWAGSGKRLGGYKISMNKPTNFEPFVLSKQAMKTMDELFRGNETVAVNFNGSLCEMVGADVYMCSTVIDDTYPDVYSYLKRLTGQKTVVTFAVNELRNCVDKLMLHTSEGQFIGRMSFEEKSAKITIEDPGNGQYGEEEIPYIGAEQNTPVVAGINLKSFKLMLRQSISDVMTFSVLDYKTAMLITNASNDKTILFVFSPVVLQEQLDKETV